MQTSIASPQCDTGGQARRRQQMRVDISNPEAEQFHLIDEPQYLLIHRDDRPRQLGQRLQEVRTPAQGTQSDPR